jgi:hypothetical protein
MNYVWIGISKLISVLCVLYPMSNPHFQLTMSTIALVHQDLLVESQNLQDSQALHR